MIFCMYYQNQILKVIISISEKVFTLCCLFLLLLIICLNYPWNTLSGRIGKVVDEHAAVPRSSTAEVALINTMHVALRGYCP